MAIKRNTFRTIALGIICIALSCLLYACSRQPIAPDPSPTIDSPPVTTQVVPTIKREIPPTPDETSESSQCNPDIIFTRDNVLVTSWDTYSHEFFYKVKGDTRYWRYSVTDKKESRGNVSLDEYEIAETAKFGIDGELIDNISPDRTKIIYSEIISLGPTPLPDTVEQAIPYVTKIYLREIDHTEYLLGEVEGLGRTFGWSSDSKYVALTMEMHSSSSNPRGVIYLLDIENKTINTILPFGASEGYSFNGFSTDNQWVFVHEKTAWMMSLQEGTKTVLELPEGAMRWWGVSSKLILIQNIESENYESNVVNSSFSWFRVEDGQLLPATTNIYAINPWREKIIAPSSDFSHLAIIDKDNRLSILKLCK